MIKNVGSTDKIIRLVLGLALIVGALLGYGIWMWVGVILVATALINWCPIYRILGLKTCPLEKS